MSRASYTRRRFFAVGGGAAGGLTLTQEAQAQEFGSNRADFSETIAAAVDDALDAQLAFAGELTLEQDVDPDLAEELVNSSRQRLSDVPSGEESSSLVRVESDELVQEMLSADISLNPNDHEFAVLRGEAEVEAEDFTDVVIDIILQSLGLDRGIRSTFREVINRLDLGESMELLRRAVSSGDWSSAERQLMTIARKLFGRQGLFLLAELLDRPTYLAVLRAVAARAVPFVGWAIFAVSLGIAIYDNRERLLPQ